MVKAFQWWWGILLAFSLLAAAGISAPALHQRGRDILDLHHGLQLSPGRVGFLSFGQPAYLALGAYATAFISYFGANPYIGILLGVLAGLLVSFIVGPCSCACAAIISRW